MIDKGEHHVFSALGHLAYTMNVANFRRLNPNYQMPNVKSELQQQQPNMPDQYGNYPPSPTPTYNPSMPFISLK